MQCYVVASTKGWNIDAFLRRRSAFPGRWLIIADPRDLTPELIQNNRPRYIFFMHWSEVVSSEILGSSECVCFHMTDVPYGRGGSPLQNLIQRKHADTKLTALRMTQDLDAGPVYRKLPLSLDGTAEAIFQRSAELSLDLMQYIVREQPQPTPQVGEPVMFKRRHPRQSALPESGTLEDIFDHIRMLDAASYPHAFVDHGVFRLEFRNVRWAAKRDSIIADVKVDIRSDETYPKGGRNGE